MWRTKGHLSDETVQGLWNQGKSWTPTSQGTSWPAAAGQGGCGWILPPPWPTQAEVSTVCDLSFCKGQQTLNPFQLCCCEPSSLLLAPVTGGCTTASKCCPNTDCSNLLLGQSSPVFLEFSTFKTVNCLHTADKEPQNRRS